MTRRPGEASDQTLDALLAGYAAGSLSAPLHALVAAHLALSPGSRAFVRTLEAAHGAALEGIAPRPLAGRDAKIDRILADKHAAPAVAQPVSDGVLPDPLARFMGKGLGEVRWHAMMPGVWVHKVDAVERGEAVLYWVRRGRRMPSHTHEGCEHTLVLKGGFTDGSGHYRRGDIAIADQEIDHRPQADEDEDCICYTVTDAPVRLTGPVGRILQRILPGRSRRTPSPRDHGGE
jgi:putative transcriptional regulator